MLRLFLISPIILLFFNPSAEAADCKVSCGGWGSAAITVDIKNRCLCIKGSKCFKIDTGRPGRNGAQTTNGTGTMSLSVNGERYQTLRGKGSTKYDRDAINMGIPENSDYGKWIHKIQNCGPGGGTSTIGCVGIPCDKWPEVKALAAQGKKVQICNGVSYRTSNQCRGPQGRCDVAATQGTKKKQKVKTRSGRR